MPGYRLTCERRGAELFVTERVADPDVTIMLRHLWTETPTS